MNSIEALRAKKELADHKLGLWLGFFALAFIAVTQALPLAAKIWLALVDRTISIRAGLPQQTVQAKVDPEFASDPSLTPITASDLEGTLTLDHIYIGTALTYAVFNALALALLIAAVLLLLRTTLTIHRGQSFDRKNARQIQIASSLAVMALALAALAEIPVVFTDEIGKLAKLEIGGVFGGSQLLTLCLIWATFFLPSVVGLLASNGKKLEEETQGLV